MGGMSLPSQELLLLLVVSLTCPASGPHRQLQHNSTEFDPFNGTGAGTGSKQLCKMPSQPWDTSHHRTAVDTLAKSPTAHKQTDPLPSGAPTTEEPEEPYYVTMYSPGTVYVSMGEYRECHRIPPGIHCSK
ncbi:hypothetical protein NHX12_017798 [Muraenolepis orangiensis]|uniref:Uncharacterized protein n=1 Tax=Muraenolepis orangiensis TaxID=630683 RepID=A0A9Q0EVU8_9TELE|nr:hypothetical protein NHX12_017798 [Muraenolepis orangiensis]